MVAKKFHITCDMKLSTKPRRIAKNQLNWPLALVQYNFIATYYIAIALILVTGNGCLKTLATSRFAAPSTPHFFSQLLAAFVVRNAVQDEAFDALGERVGAFDFVVPVLVGQCNVAWQVHVEAVA